MTAMMFRDKAAVSKTDNVGLPQQVLCLDGKVYSMIFDDRFHVGQPWRYTSDPRGEIEGEQHTATLTQLSRYIGIRRVIRDAEGRLV